MQNEHDLRWSASIIPEMGIWRRSIFWMCLASIAVFALQPLPLLGHRVEARLSSSLGHRLELRIARPMLDIGRDVDGIIVLGGSPTRVREALSLADRFPNVPIVLSGPGAAEITLAEASPRHGNRIVVDRRATTTYENALFSRDLVRPDAGQCWVVVTSAVHMPRAIGAFQAVEFPVVPWPVGDTPQTSAARSAWVWHEVLGLAVYWALGRSSDLYPRCASGACTLHPAPERCLPS